MVAIENNAQYQQVKSDVSTSSRRVALPVILYIAAILLPLEFGFGPINMTGVRAVLLVMFMPMLINLFMGKYGPRLATDYLFLVHIFWVLVALAVNNPEQAIANAGSTGVEFIGGYLLGRAYIRSAADFTALLRLLCVLSLLLLPLALMELPTGRAVLLDFLNKLPGVNSILDVETSPRKGMFRVQAVFAHPIHFGLFCTIVFSLCFVGLKGVYSMPRRWITSLVVGFCALLSLSSGALLAVALQLGLIFWAWTFRNTVHRWKILLAVFVLLYILIDLLSNRTPIMVFLSYATFSAHTAYFRTAIFEWGMVNVWANPIFGIGLNDWVRLAWMYNPSVDNFWLLNAMRYGIPGFLFLAVGYVIGLWKVGKRELDGNPELWRLRRAWMFCFAGLTFTLCTVHIWHNIYSFVFFIFGAGMWLRSVVADPVQGDPEADDADAQIPTEVTTRYTRFAHKNRLEPKRTVPKHMKRSRPKHQRTGPGVKS